MNGNAVPQVEYVGGVTPQETAALLNARIIELQSYNPTFERSGDGFWITYTKKVRRCTEDAKPVSNEYPRCAECPYFEHVDDSVKWGRCHRYGGASVNQNKRVCTTYWKSEIGGDVSNA